MVDLRFDAVSKMDLNDCYVAVRIGEVQKLMRLPTTRTLSFPKAGDRHYGKVEIYRRIGGCGVDFDPAKAGDRQVNLNCGASGDLRLNISVEGSAEGERAAARADRVSESGAKAKAAKEYLRKHSVELQLSEAMQSLLKEKPEDPINFLVNKLLAGQSAVLPTFKKSGGKNLDLARDAGPKRGARLDTIKEMASPMELGELGSVETVRSTEEPCAKAPVDFARLPSVGTWLAPRPKAAPTMSVKHADSDGTAVEEPVRGAAGPPNFALRPSVGTWLAARPRAAPAPAPAARPAPTAAPPAFARLPSVGTWLAPRPCARPETKAIVSSAILPREREEVPVATPWHLKPSVGWLLHKLSPPAAAEAPKVDAAAPQTQAAASATARGAAPKSAARRPSALVASSASFRPGLMSLSMAPGMMII